VSKPNNKQQENRKYMPTIIEIRNDEKLKALFLKGDRNLKAGFALAKKKGLTSTQLASKFKEWEFNDDKVDWLTKGYELYLVDPNVNGDFDKIVAELTPKPEIRWYKESRNVTTRYKTPQKWANENPPWKNVKDGASRGESAVRQLMGGGWRWSKLMEWYWRYIQIWFPEETRGIKMEFIKKEAVE
jgi:hypothetical protein